MPNCKEVDPSRKKYFEINPDGKDGLALLFPSVKTLKYFHRCVEILLERVEDSDIPGRYITQVRDWGRAKLSY